MSWTHCCHVSMAAELSFLLPKAAAWGLKHSSLVEKLELAHLSKGMERRSRKEHRSSCTDRPRRMGYGLFSLQTAFGLYKNYKNEQLQEQNHIKARCRCCGSAGNRKTFFLSQLTIQSGLFYPSLDKDESLFLWKKQILKP